MAKFAANLSLLYPEFPFMDRFQACAEDGFKGVEAPQLARATGCKRIHVQIAGVPDRQEPNRGELHYPYLLRSL